jgi:TPR repeat protein
MRVSDISAYSVRFALLQDLRARNEELSKQLADAAGVATRCSLLEGELSDSKKSLADARLEGADVQAALIAAQKRLPELEAQLAGGSDLQAALAAAQKRILELEVQVEEEAQGWARCTELEAELAAANKHAARVSELEAELDSTKARARRASIITSELSDELGEAKMLAANCAQLEAELSVCNDTSPLTLTHSLGLLLPFCPCGCLAFSHFCAHLASQRGMRVLRTAQVVRGTQQVARKFGPRCAELEAELKAAQDAYAVRIADLDAVCQEKSASFAKAEAERSALASRILELEHDLSEQRQRALSKEQEAALQSAEASQDALKSRIRELESSTAADDDAMSETITAFSQQLNAQIESLKAQLAEEKRHNLEVRSRAGAVAADREEQMKCKILDLDHALHVQAKALEQAKAALASAERGAGGDNESAKLRNSIAQLETTLAEKAAAQSELEKKLQLQSISFAKLEEEVNRIEMMESKTSDAIDTVSGKAKAALLQTQQVADMASEQASENERLRASVASMEWTKVQGQSVASKKQTLAQRRMSLVKTEEDIETLRENYQECQVLLDLKKQELDKLQRSYNRLTIAGPVGDSEHDGLLNELQKQDERLHALEQENANLKAQLNGQSRQPLPSDLGRPASPAVPGRRMAGSISAPGGWERPDDFIAYPDEGLPKRRASQANTSKLFRGESESFPDAGRGGRRPSVGPPVPAGAQHLLLAGVPTGRRGSVSSVSRKMLCELLILEAADKLQSSDWEGAIEKIRVAVECDSKSAPALIGLRLLLLGRPALAKDSGEVDDLLRRGFVLSVDLLAEGTKWLIGLIDGGAAKPLRHKHLLFAILGVCWLRGWGVEADANKACATWCEAADFGAGCPLAQQSVAGCYESGVGSELDQSKALEYTQRAAEQTHAGAQYSLGWCYQHGLAGLEVDDTEAAAWFCKAAGQGHVNAMYSWALILDDVEKQDKDIDTVFYLYSQAAQKGHAGAQFSLAMLHENGVGCDRDPEVAFQWYEKAALQGIDAAQCNLGWCYKHGVGVEANKYSASKWSVLCRAAAMHGSQPGIACWTGAARIRYRLAALQGHAIAQYNLAHCFLDGQGAVQDNAQAARPRTPPPPPPPPPPRAPPPPPPPPPRAHHAGVG